MDHSSQSYPGSFIECAFERRLACFLAGCRRARVSAIKNARQQTPASTTLVSVTHHRLESDSLNRDISALAIDMEDTDLSSGSRTRRQRASLASLGEVFSELSLSNVPDVLDRVCVRHQSSETAIQARVRAVRHNSGQPEAPRTEYLVECLSEVPGPRWQSWLQLDQLQRPALERSAKPSEDGLAHEIGGYAGVRHVKCTSSHKQPGEHNSWTSFWVSQNGTLPEKCPCLGPNGQHSLPQDLSRVAGMHCQFKDKHGEVVYGIIPGCKACNTGELPIEFACKPATILMPSRGFVAGTLLADSTSFVSIDEVSGSAPQTRVKGSSRSGPLDQTYSKDVHGYIRILAQVLSGENVVVPQEDSFEEAEDESEVLSCSDSVVSGADSEASDRDDCIHDDVSGRRVGRNDDDDSGRSNQYTAHGHSISDDAASVISVESRRSGDNYGGSHSGRSESGISDNDD